MLVYILTDAAIEPAVLDAICARPSRSASTASPSTATPRPTTPSCCSPPAPAARPSAPDNAAFAAALTQVCTSLARQIVADGEGITHVVELRIEGAATDADALKIAKAIAHSPLVKTAWAGSDPNWGAWSPPSATPARKSIPTASTSTSAICPSAATAAAPRSSTKPPPLTPTSPSRRVLHRHPAPPGRRSGQCVFWTTDLTVEYIHINADYSCMLCT
jgi:glutamate N-acetyltransferase / amino-acid N-acetyltransferase